MDKSTWDWRGREYLERKRQAARQAYVSGKYKRCRRLLAFLAKADKKYAKAARAYAEYIREVERGARWPKSEVLRMSQTQVDRLAQDPWDWNGGPADLLAAMVEDIEMGRGSGEAV